MLELITNYCINETLPFVKVLNRAPQMPKYTQIAQCYFETQQNSQLYGAPKCPILNRYYEINNAKNE